MARPRVRSLPRHYAVRVRWPCLASMPNLPPTAPDRVFLPALVQRHLGRRHWKGGPGHAREGQATWRRGLRRHHERNCLAPQPACDWHCSIWGRRPCDALLPRAQAVAPLRTSACDRCLASLASSHCSIHRRAFPPIHPCWQAGRRCTRLHACPPHNNWIRRRRKRSCEGLRYLHSKAGRGGISRSFPARFRSFKHISKE